MHIFGKESPMTLVDKILVLVLALGVWTGIALYAVSIEPARADHIAASDVTGLDEWIVCDYM